MATGRIPIGHGVSLIAHGGRARPSLREGYVHTRDVSFQGGSLIDARWSCDQMRVDMCPY